MKTKKKNKKNEQNEHREQEIISKHFYNYLEACCEELDAQSDEDMGYFFYLTAALSMGGLRDTGLCKHKASDIMAGVLNTAYKEESNESCEENGLH
jgi:hypothetical protein